MKTRPPIQNPSRVAFVALTLVLVLSRGAGVCFGGSPGEAIVSEESALMDRLARAREMSDSAREWVEPADQQLSARQENTPAAQLPAAIDEARRLAHSRRVELEQLLKELEELRAGLHSNETLKDEDLASRIRELEEQLASASRDLVELAGEQAELVRRLKEDRKKPGVSPEIMVQKKELAVTIRRNLIAPIKEPYFSVRFGLLQSGGRGAEFTPTRDGVPLSAALGAGGILDALIANSDPEDAYVACLVAPDSIATYYALIKELRKRNFAHNWIPWTGKAFVVALGKGGGEVGVQK